MYRRAELWPTTTLVIALSLIAIYENGVAREFHPADPRSEGDPAVQALHHMGRLIADKSGERPRIRVLHSRRPGEEKGLGGEQLAVFGDSGS